jgi:hypothetical protein
VGTVGFIHDTGSTISAIREILGHYDLGFPVVRELLQNADDAHATTIEIGWLPSLDDARNPLLQGPALFVLNNGPFTESNEGAIRRISGSDKGSQDGAIGKFGRGLKSVFNLCEGFVYANSVQAGGGDGPWPLAQANLLTPWDLDVYHQEWDGFDDEHGQAIARAIAPFLPKGQPWFCLWIPLRRDTRGLPPIKEGVFPGDSDEPPQFLIDEVARGCVETMQSLPMLRSLECVRYWLPRTGHDQGPVEVRFEPGSSRRTFVAGDTAPGECVLRGAISVGGSPGGPRQGLYVGREVLLERSEVFEEIRDRPEWPVRDVISGGKEKGEPHAAAVFLARPSNGAGSLRVFDAVFLPVGHPAEAPIPTVQWDIDLILHGYSFVNSNRTAIERDASPNDVARRVRADWNRELRSRGVLPSILPALEQFVAATGMPVSDSEVLTDSLATWLRQRGADLADARRSYQWLPCISPKGDPEYRLLAADRPYFELPAGPVAPELPLRVFPAAAQLAGRVAVTFRGMARLAGSPSPWAPDDLSTLLHSVPASEVFASETAVSYLAAMLDATSPASGNLQQTLISKLQEALVSPGLVRMKDSPGFRRVLRHVDPGLLLTFDDRQLAAAARVVNEATGYLASAAVGVLVLPASAVGEAQQGGPAPFELGDDDAGGLLRALVEAPVSLRSEDAFRQIRARLADMVFRLDGRAGQVARAEFGDSPLFRGWVAGSGDADISFNDILRAVGTRRLLRRNTSGGFDPAPALAEAAALVGDLLVVPDYVEAAGADLPRCSVAGCAEILLQAPRLAPVPQRRAFLEKLLESHSREGAVSEAVRYLLHGNFAALGSDAPLLFGEVHGDVWSKLAHQSLGDANWRFVDGGLVQQIPAALHVEIRLERIHAATVTALIRQRGPGAVDCGDDSLTDSDRERILREVYDRDLLRALPMHRDVSGAFGPIDEHTYVEGAFDLAPELAHAVRLLRPLGPEMEARLGLSQWTPGAAIDEALAQEHPGALAHTILDALAATSGPIADVTRSTLRSTAWLPLAVGAFVRPEDVVHIKGLDDHIARIAAKCGGAYYDVGMVAKNFREHPGFAKLREGVLLAGREALETLPLMIEAAALSELVVGPIELPADLLDAFVRSFQGAPLGVMEASSLFEAARQVFTDDVVTTNLASPLLRAISRARSTAILNYLSGRHRAAGRHEKNSVRDLFERYLAAARSAGFDSGWLTEVPLLNQRGEWRPSAELCHDYPNVDAAWLVDARQAEILGLGQRASPAPSSVVDPGATKASGQSISSSEAGATLERYFSGWRNRCPDEAIGGFLAFLGDDPGVRELARYYLGMRKVATVREMLEWEPLPAYVGGGGEDVGTTMRQQRFVVEVVPPGAPQQVKNVLGGAISVPVAQDLTSLIQNRLFDSPIRGRTNLLRLFDIDPANHDSPTLSALLRASTFAILADVYYQGAYRDQGPSRLDEFWKDLEDSHLVDLRTAQEVVIHHLLSSAKLLKIGPAPALRELIRMEEAGVRGGIEGEKIPDERKRNHALHDAERRRREARAGLEYLLRVGDVSTTTALLEAVRHRIGSESQYTPASVAFELFQNADDAAVERDELGSAVPGHLYTFVVDREPTVLSFGHQGRGINEFRPASGAAERFRERDFHRDLEKMLLLGASDKGVTQQERVTGKFGLGFKSVFLLTKAPRIVSGRLAVEVVGGVYPLAITGDHYTQLASRLAEIGVPGGTLIELPIEPEREEHATSAVDAFYRHAPLLTVFAQRTNCIVLRVAGREESLEWAPREVNGAPWCLVGLLPGASSRGLPTHALIVMARVGALLLGLDARGMVRLPAHTPGIWVTAPTTEAEGAGLALNGPFELHAGRSELASTASAANHVTAASLGVALGEALQELATAAEADWEGVRRDLVLSDDANPYAFWESMLDVLAQTRRPGEAFELLRAALWPDASRGAARLFGSCRVLPSGLPGEHRRLLLAREVRFQVSGLLATQEFFAPVMSLDQVLEQAPPGTAIARSVVEIIPLVGLVEGEPLDLARALQWVFQDKRYVVEPALASTLGELLGAEHLDDGHGTKSERDDAVHLRNLLDDLRFRASDGSPHRPRELVAGGLPAKGVVDDDEVLRAVFAPESAKLSGDYNEAGVRFFILCRGRMEANSTTLVDWGKQAEGDKLDGFLEYAQKGRLRADVQDVVRDDPAWLLEKGAAELVRARAKDVAQAAFQAVALGLDPSPGAPSPLLIRGVSPAPEPLTAGEASDALDKLADWWRRAGSERLRRYDASVYPAGSPLLAGRTVAELEEWREPGIRQLWMRLFVLAAAHTLGRQRPEQHRGFLERFEREGWLNLFATPHSEWDGQEWLNRLRSYVDGLVDDDAYARWMTLFIPLFQVAYRLEDYIELFVVADRDLGTGMSFNQFLDPARNSAYSGGGLRPPGVRTGLGIGAHFVLREMARAGLITAAAAQRHCIVPRERVINLLAELGCDVRNESRPDRSRIMADFLRGHLGDNWHFDAAFDVALYEVASDAGLQVEFFGRQLVYNGGWW